MKPWYMQSVQQVETFFDVDSNQGLDTKNVDKRLKKFGYNVDPSLAPAMRKIYKTNVRRGGFVHNIDIQRLMLGDVVLLKAGDRVPADLRLAQVDNLYIDESVLHGNAMPTPKNTFAMHQEGSFIDQKCMAFAGSFVTEGFGTGLVVANANKTLINRILPKTANQHHLTLKLRDRRLHKLGVTIQNNFDSHLLSAIDVVFIDAETSEKNILEVIRKIQFNHGLACKFIVAESVAQRLAKEINGALIYHGNQMAKHVPKQYLGMINDIQFIADADLTDILKVMYTMKKHDIKTLWVSDGRRPTPIMQVATVSMIIGNHARDDCLIRANLIAPMAKLTILARILYNDK